jgi:hypothetical protein
MRSLTSGALAALFVACTGCSALLDLDADFDRDAAVIDAMPDVPVDDGGSANDGGEHDAMITLDADPEDATVPADAGPSEFADLPPLSTAEGPADYTCMGDWGAPGPADEVTFFLEVRDFLYGDTISNICVNVYADNSVPQGDACGGVTTDASGRVEVTTNGAWFAYRLFPSEDEEYMGSVQVNVPSPGPGGTVVGAAVSEAMRTTVPALLGRQYDADNAYLSGSLYDCQEDYVGGGVVRVVRDGAVLPTGAGATDLTYSYFGDALYPDNNRTSTNASNGLYLAFNVPVQAEGERVQVVACGKPDGETVEMIGCEEVSVFSDTVNILSLHPTRADGPACPDICSP